MESRHGKSQEGVLAKELGDRYYSNITKLCWHSYLTGLRPFLPIIFVYFKSLGFSYLEIGALFSIQAITVLILEIPAGTIADKFGAKYSLILSGIFLSSTFLVIPWIQTFDWMTLAFVLWGAGKACYSGSDTTVIIESLKWANRSEQTSKYLGKKWSAFYFGLASGGLLCPIIITFSYQWTFLFAGVLHLLAIVLLYTLASPPLDRSEKSQIQKVKTLKQYFLYLKAGKDYLLEHRTVKYLLIFTVMFSTCSLIFFQYLQRILQDSQISEEYFGYFYTCFIFIAAVSSRKVHVVDQNLGEKRTIFMLLALTFFALIGPALTDFYPLTLVPLIVMQFQAGIYIPIMNHYINGHIESHNRTTLNSIKSFMAGTTMAILSPIVGKIADSWSYQNALVLLAAILLLVSLGPSLKISSRLSRKRSAQ